MLNRKHSIDGKNPFGDGGEIFDSLPASASARLAMIAGDISLVVDEAGRIVDGSANPNEFPDLDTWIGKDWLDVVTVESRPKVMEMLAAGRKGQTQHWRQVNHPGGEGDIPVRYAIVPLEGRKLSLAVGRDMRESSMLQQRLLQAQQSLERDYLRLRHLETRYRLLFDQSSEAVLIVEADSYKVREANSAAHQMLGVKAGSLIGAKLTGFVARNAKDPLIAFLGAVMTSRSVSPIELSDARGEPVVFKAVGFRQHGAQFILVRLADASAADQGAPHQLLDAVEAMPDAFVLADSGMAITAANLAFVEMVGAASADQIRGRPLSDFLGRPGVDLELIASQLAKHGFARNVATIVGGHDGEEGEPVELSAVRTDGEDPSFGFVIRAVGRRLRDLPPTAQDLPRSVEQLTDLVGRMALKDIVRESTDLIERLCIEAALSYTSDNRASAAEILGLSRQSLYSKLHRYGLGNLVTEEE